ncbi:MAG: glutamate--tRNA ligase [Finegoldia sp.]|nr:glutamate--tRNA ligase [Finegoldia sp.]
MSEEVRVRFAPSPTGFLHIGGLRTALYNYLYAKKHDGKFLLRIEDTDRTRYVEGAIENLLEQLKWAGVNPDEGVVLDDDGNITQKGDFGPYIQSERVKQGIYDKYINILLEKGYAYYCFCSKERLDAVKAQQKADGLMPKYDGLCRGISLEEARERVAKGEEHVIRLKLPENREITFNDAIKGKITFNTNDMDDQVLIKSDGFPTYHFAVVVDDHLMGITHVVRGDEWISSTAKHVYLYECFGWEPPQFVHLPVVLNKSGKKLSKRKDDVSVADFRNKGYLPEGLVNYLALVGWSSEDGEEILPMQALEEKFDFDRVSKSGGVFDSDKLDWVNQHYIKDLSDEDFAAYIEKYLIDAGLIQEDYPQDKLLVLGSLFKESVSKFEDVVDQAKFLFEDYKMEEDAKEFLAHEKLADLMTSLKKQIEGADSFDRDLTSSLMKKVQKETGIKGKDLWMPTRAIVSGNVHGPDLGDIMYILGKDEVLKRIDLALESLENK